ENLPDDIQIGINAISQQAKRMTQIVEDLLMLSSLEMETSETQTEHEIVQVPLMLESMCEDAILLSGDAKHHVHLDVQSNSCLLGHQSDIVSAFRNLIDNAICHTPPGSTVFIRWDTVNGNARLSVQDNGLGIDEKHIPRLTERFYRVDKGRSRDMGGTGLGLSIAKHAIQRNGGELTITSQRGKGSTFQCSFPAERVYKPELEQPGFEAQA
ncbi:MAG: ATP-binding protein, partial [Gammaproteobacteria bacterium]|nr:ATP-binding protein [Gammaproteobacteria bacterium]